MTSANPIANIVYEGPTLAVTPTAYIIWDPITGPACTAQNIFFQQYIDCQNVQTVTSASVDCNPQASIYVGGSITYPPETDEQRQAREALELQETIKRAAATKRAEELLMLMLNDKQKKQYRELGYFDTEIKDRKYRINKGYAGNVQLIEKEIAVARFCIHPTQYLPDPDTMLSQLLLLKTDEKKFLETANKTILYG